MSFNRLSYDECAEKNRVRDSVAVGNYQVNTPILCSTCFQDNPMLINQHGGVSMPRNVDWRFYTGPVDIESELQNINRPASNCPSQKYIPKCPNCGVIVSGQPCGDGVSLSCHNCRLPLPKGAMCNRPTDMVNFPDCHFPTEDTRLSNPPSTLRGTGWNRFEDLCLDPQAQLEFPAEYHIPTRLVFRDNHRPCVRMPKINSMNPEDYR